MIDREKIIAKLEKEVKRTYAIKTTLFHGTEKVGEEITVNREPYVTLTIEMADKILALLKEQEAVEPKQVVLNGKDEWWGLVCVCPDCKAEWMSDKADTHFCPKCGRAVKWE
jgi:exosome complex RNA-binding protein Csl4